MLDAGADIEARDEHGFTALAAAGLAGHPAMVALLKRHGAKASLMQAFLGVAVFGHKDVLKALLFPRITDNAVAAICPGSTFQRIILMFSTLLY